jgi:dTDP-4-amino-4,6-dideoxygalactose transaminase
MTACCGPGDPATEASMNVPLLDLEAQYRSIQDEVLRAVHEVLASQQFILGPAVGALESRIAAACGCRHAVGVSSGSDALLMCLMAEGIGPGDEVVTTPFTFFATIAAIMRVGATPRFVDICPVTFNLDAARLADAVTPRTRAIMPVHLFGLCADMDPVMECAREHGLVVIEDAAQSLGATHRGRHAGTIGDYGCYSFFTSKNLGGAGDGGMVVTDDDARADRLRLLRVQGARPKYHHQVVGGNFRLDTLQAAIVGAKLGHLDRWTEMRRANAAHYAESLAAVASGASGLLALPHEPADRRHVYNQFVVRVADRDHVRACLAEQGIATEVYYPVPAHLQPAVAGLGLGPGAFPVSERCALECLALPVYPELPVASASAVTAALAAAVGHDDALGTVHERGRVGG